MGVTSSACSSCDSTPEQQSGDDYWLTVGRRAPDEALQAQLEDPPPDFPDLPASSLAILTESWGLDPMQKELPHIPDFKEVERPDWTLDNWTALGGEEVEGALSSAALALLSAKWLIRAQESEGTLAPRQAMPDEAFLSLSQVQAASTNGFGYVLHVACVSHCWLRADHPDPFGHNLGALARCLQLLVQDAAYGGRWAVFFDFCSMHQSCRDSEGRPQQEVYQWSPVDHAYDHGAIGRYESEEAIFDKALGHLGTVFSHPSTLVLMLSTFPHDYADMDKYARKSNREAYAGRGWCYCEASWAMLVKEQSSVLDLGKDCGDASSWIALTKQCAADRRALVLPAVFSGELEHKDFSNSQVDFDRVSGLYAAGFQERFATTTELSYHRARWGDEDARAFADLLSAGAAPSLCKVDLAENHISDEGAAALANALASGKAPALTSLNLSHNHVGDAGAVALAHLLSPSGSKLAHLDLSHNHVGDEGAQAILAELKRDLDAGQARPQVWLTSNPIGKAALTSKKASTAAAGKAGRKNSTHSFSLLAG